MRKGFTLIELIIVVIAIGILATIAVPQYLKAVERAKSAKAKHALSLVSQAEKMYRAQNDTYLAVGAGADLNNSPGLGDFVEMADVAADCASGDWCITVDNVTTSTTAQTFRTVATRQSGSVKGDTITLDQDGLWDGTLPKDLGGYK
ncbi:MAG: prepilin-type N-terminal cleavage/methylation domain-containing protein [Candidatus Omnitrophota bacterium]|jgi:prepilin-type N-terminal cleavage/methylation domain-containing protein